MKGKKISLFFIALFVLFAVTFVACDKSELSVKDVAGTYYKSADAWIELKSDGNWRDSEGGSGKFSVKDNNVIIEGSGIGLSKGAYSDGVITFSTGKYTRSATALIGTEAKVTSVTSGAVSGLKINCDIKATAGLNLNTAITVSKGAKWQTYRDEALKNSVSDNKLVSLNEGNNVFYISITSEDGKKSQVYTLNVFRNFPAKITYVVNGSNYKVETKDTHTYITSWPTPTIEGYDFQGWSGAEASYYIEGHVTFTAIVEVKSYTINLDPNAGINNGDATKKVTYNSSFQLPVPTREGYDFKGWAYVTSSNTRMITDTGGNSTSVWTVDSSAPIQVTAQWQVKKFKFKATMTTGGTITPTTYTNEGSYDYGATINLTANTTVGSTWLGWYEGNLLISPNLTFAYTIPARDSVLQAKWDIYTLSVTKNIDEGGVVDVVGGTGKKVAGTNVSMTATTYRGYTFLGWYEGEERVETGAKYDFVMPNASKNIIAKWELNSDLAGFVFTSDINTLVITGYTGDATDIIIPSAATSIEAWAFGNSINKNNITSVSIPASVTTIGNYAFLNCENLATVTFASASGLKTINESAFSGCGRLANIVLPSGLTTIGKTAFYGCAALTTINIPEYVTAIGANAFEYCIGLTNIFIPSRVTNVGAGAFINCGNITVHTAAGVNLPPGWVTGWNNNGSGGTVNVHPGCNGTDL